MLSKKLYIKKMLPHIENDSVVDREEVNDSERLLIAICAQLVKVLQTGSENQHEERVKAA